MNNHCRLGNVALVVEVVDAVVHIVGLSETHFVALVAVGDQAGVEEDDWVVDSPS